MSKENYFYRVAHKDTKVGLWYDQKGEFTGLIHTKFKFCKNNKLPMPFDPEIQGYLSATKTLNELYEWFTKQDILNLQSFGYKVFEYKANDFKYAKGGHWVIDQETSVINRAFEL